MNQADSDGWTVLMKASIKCDLDVAVKCILAESGVNVNQADSDCDTALMHESFGGHLDAVKSILTEREVNVDHSSGNGYTALMTDLSSRGERPFIWML